MGAFTLVFVFLTTLIIISAIVEYFQKGK